MSKGQQIEINCLICNEVQKLTKNCFNCSINNADKKTILLKNIKILEKLFKNWQLEPLRKVLNSSNIKKTELITCVKCQVALVKAEVIFTQINILEKQLESLKGRVFCALQNNNNPLSRQSTLNSSSTTNTTTTTTSTTNSSRPVRASARKSAELVIKVIKDENKSDEDDDGNGSPGNGGENSDDTDFSDLNNSDDENINLIGEIHLNDNNDLLYVPQEDAQENTTDDDGEYNVDNIQNKIKDIKQETQERDISNSIAIDKNFDEDFKCTLCSAQYKTKRFFDQHMEKVHGEIFKKNDDEAEQATSNKFCPNCPDLVFTDSTLLNLHINQHKKSSCKICGKEIRNDYMRKHLRLHSGEKTVKCHYCDDKFSAHNVLEPHIAKMHPEHAKHRCQRDGCDKTFPSINRLNSHVNNKHHPERRFKCLICEKRFVTPKDLEIHKSTHDTSNMEKCSICSKSISKFYLDRHMQTYHSERKFTCFICKVVKNDKYALQRHMKTHKKGEKNLFCEICRKGPFYFDGLKAHKKTHGQKIQCDKCEKSFVSEQMLEIHATLHTNLKTVECNLCPRTFTHKYYLRGHKFQVHGEMTMRGSTNNTNLNLEEEECEDGEETMEQDNSTINIGEQIKKEAMDFN